MNPGVLLNGKICLSAEQFTLGKLKKSDIFSRKARAKLSLEKVRTKFILGGSHAIEQYMAGSCQVLV